MTSTSTSTSTTARLTRLERLAQLLLNDSNGLSGSEHGPYELDADLLYGSGDEDVVGDLEFAGDDWLVGTDVYDEELLRLINEHATTSDSSGGVGEALDGLPAGEDGRPGTSGVSGVSGVCGTRTALSTQSTQSTRPTRDAGDDDECTFAPKTGRGPCGRSRADAVGGLSVSERLFTQRHNNKREAAILRHREEEERKFREACTFAPRLVDSEHSKVRSARYQVPLRERVGMEWRRREEAVKRATAEADAECTFRPLLNETSRKLVEARKARETVGGVRRRMAVAPGDGVEGGGVKATKESKRILERSSAIPKAGFHARQAYFGALKEKKQAMMEARAAAETRARANAFVANVLPVAGRGILEESRDQWVMRMTYGEAEKAMRRREMRKRELEQEFGFKPALNDASLAMCADLPSIRERTASVAARAGRGPDAVDSAVDAACTFRPDTSKAPVKGFYGRYRVPQAPARGEVTRAARAKTDRMRAAMERMEAEKLAREMAECTFKPQTNGRVRRPAEGAVRLEDMPGMEGWAQRLAMQHDSEAEKKAREETVFGAGRNWTGGVTVCRPFDLSRGSSS